MKDQFFATYFNTQNSIDIPIDTANYFINKKYKRIVVKITCKEKSMEFHAALQKSKNKYYILFSKEKQKKLNVLVNDGLEITLSKDTSKYGVEMPEEFEAVLQSDFDGASLFESLTDGKKRGLIYHILKIKNSQTRIDKALIIIENLKRGIRDQRELIKKF